MLVIFTASEEVGYTKLFQLHLSVETLNSCSRRDRREVHESGINGKNTKFCKRHI